MAGVSIAVRLATDCNTHQHDQRPPVPGGQFLQSFKRRLSNGRGHVLAQVDLARAGAHASLLLGTPHLAQAPLLLGERCLHGGVSIVFLETGRGELLGRGRKQCLAEVLAPQLAHKGQTRRGKQHLLTHRGGVWHVCHGHQGRGGRVASQDDVEGFIGLDVRLQQGLDVGCEGAAGGRGRQQL